MGFLCRAEGGSTCYESFKKVLEIETLTDTEEADQRRSPTLRWGGGHWDTCPLSVTILFILKFCRFFRLIFFKIANCSYQHCLIGFIWYYKYLAMKRKQNQNIIFIFIFRLYIFQFLCATATLWKQCKL